MFEKDLATMYADPLLNESASIGAKSTTGAFEWTEEFENDGSGLVSVRRRTFTFEIGSPRGYAFSLVALEDATITINGTSYRVRNPKHISEHRMRLVLA